MIQHKLALTKLSKIAYCMEGCDVPWDIITLSIWHILCYLLPYYFLTYILQNITCCITISCYVDWLYSMLWTQAQWSDGTIDDGFLTTCLPLPVVLLFMELHAQWNSFITWCWPDGVCWPDKCMASPLLLESQAPSATLLGLSGCPLSLSPYSDRSTVSSVSDYSHVGLAVVGLAAAAYYRLWQPLRRLRWLLPIPWCCPGSRLWSLLLHQSETYAAQASITIIICWTLNLPPT